MQYDISSGLLLYKIWIFFWMIDDSYTPSRLDQNVTTSLQLPPRGTLDWHDDGREELRDKQAYLPTVDATSWGHKANRDGGRWG